MNVQEISPEIQQSMMLVDMACGPLYASAVRVVVELEIADKLRDGAKTAVELAGGGNLHPQSLYRVLRFMASRGIFAEDGEGRFTLTPAAELLRSDAPGSLRAATLMLTADNMMEAGIKLLHGVKTGRCPFDHVHGAPFFAYLQNHPERAQVFDLGMAAFSDSENAPIAGAYDFSPYSRVMDVGGGHGGFLVEVLKKHPSLRGILYDQAHVAHGTKRLREGGVAARAEVISGDFFHSVPRGSDVYVVKRVLHDWDDAKCVTILKHCREVLPPHGRVLVVDAVLAAGNAPDFAKAIDLMMMSVSTGRERTESEFKDLFAAAGLELTRVIPTPSMLSIVEGVPADLTA